MILGTALGDLMVVRYGECRFGRGNHVWVERHTKRRFQSKRNQLIRHCFEISLGGFPSLDTRAEVN
jgi:hypothetical protein